MAVSLLGTGLSVQGQVGDLEGGGLGLGNPLHMCV